MEFQRILDLPKLLKQKSFFLFGPRATGKTFLIRHQLKDQALMIDLLRSDLFLQLSSAPSDLESLVQRSSKDTIIVIDEVQKIPALLDEVHRLIEEKHIRFLLTGSSARKLKRGHANMLGGRAWTAQLFPLCWKEIPEFDLDRYLQFGGLPVVWASTQPVEELDAYVQTYLKEEILAEGLIRKLPPFSRFLRSAALSNGQMLNYEQVASDAQVPATTVREYYAILQDTLIGFLLEPWTVSKKRKAIQMAKFYFFDPGVTHMIAGTKSLDRNSNLYGNSFEQFIGMELRAYLSYRRIKEELTFWRSTHGHEVDYLVGKIAAIEVKSATRATAQHEKGLRTLQEEAVFKKFFLVTQDRVESARDGITRMHWQKFLQQLWNDQLL
jgi:predicted AAA+ superfamily ATPase